jgi:hypothetical protein
VDNASIDISCFGYTKEENFVLNPQTFIFSSIQTNQNCTKLNTKWKHLFGLEVQL